MLVLRLLPINIANGSIDIRDNITITQKDTTIGFNIRNRNMTNHTKLLAILNDFTICSAILNSFRQF